MDERPRRIENPVVHADPVSAPTKDGRWSSPSGQIRIAGGTDARVAYVRAALTGDRLRLAAQPIADLRTGGGAVGGEELLLRLVRPDGQLALPPGSLVAAEKYASLITRIDAWVVERAAEMAAP